MDRKCVQDRSRDKTARRMGEKPDGLRRVGRPKIRWRDQVARDPGMLGVNEGDAEDRGLWSRLTGVNKGRLRFVKPG